MGQGENMATVSQSDQGRENEMPSLLKHIDNHVNNITSLTS